MRDQILILNFEDSYAASIATKLRAEKIACMVLPGSATTEQVMAEQSLGIILAGGLTGQIPDQLDGQLLRSGIPLLALGDTAAPVCALLGGQYGDVLSLNEVDTMCFQPSRVTRELTESERMFLSFRPLELTDDLHAIANVGEHILGFTHKTLDIYALDCQLESNDPDIMSILMQFAMDVCGATQWWSVEAFINQAKADLVAAANQRPALCILSGGLDSGVAALLAQKALGNQLTCIFVDTGLLRENEVVETTGYYRRAGLNLLKIDASQRFFQALKNLKDQSAKLKAIMGTLQSELSRAIASLEYHLLVDSASTQLNTTGTSQRFTLAHLHDRSRIICPLHGLYKEEIRQVGEALGMPQEITRMQPFPWTGLGLRVTGECTPQKIRLLRRADAIFQEEIRDAGLNKRLWKYFVTLHHMPCEQNHEALIIALRAVSSSLQGNDIKAIPARLPYDLLERFTGRILSNHPQVIKVVYDLTPGSSLQDAEWN
jgi:GMP synthase (glutamine-hydrolysing)